MNTKKLVRGMNPVRALMALSILLALSDAFAGMSQQSTDRQGMSQQGMSQQGMSQQGMSQQGMSQQGMSQQGMSQQGMSQQGMSQQGMSQQGMSQQGMFLQGMSQQGMSQQGMSQQSMSLEGMSQRGVDRLRGLANLVDFRGIERANVQVTNVNLQGLQIPGNRIVYSPVNNPMTGVRLQRSPTDAIGQGSYLFVPGLAGSDWDIAGTFWNLIFYDTADPAADSTHRAEIITYVAAVERDTRYLNSSSTPSNDDIYLYTVYYRQPATGQWSALCPSDEEGKNRAMAVPLNANDWSSEASRTKIAFACTASGVAAKCARNWGYKPWVPTYSWFYDLCLISARADYCQIDQSFTRDGTPIDMFDWIPSASGETQINSKVGFSENPFEKKPMLHEEYQVSLFGLVGEVFTPQELSGVIKAIPDIAQLHLSGLKSSRYPDLDPGRCRTAPYVIGRCEPGQTFECRRADTAANFPWGPYVAVNSAAHCNHHEGETGDPLDPMCSACTSRVCEVDPTCCGNPNGSVFPGSLIWGGHCTKLREQVCRTTPLGAATENLWPLGVVATGGVGKPSTILRGAIGAFEGIVTSGGVQYAEGWACDPDYPNAPSTVQISVASAAGANGSLNASGTTLLTAVADQQLASSWRQIVEDECGGGGRHGFRVALPSGPAGREVFVYGIDIDWPGTPFSLLRGGKKLTPGQSVTGPRAAIYTGWVEPAVSDVYSFAVEAALTDKFRLWVNGTYMAGNWTDPPGTLDGFMLPPPTTAPRLFLQKGVRYAVRVEYLRPDTSPTGSSRLNVTWVRPLASPPQNAQSIPLASLYAMAQSNGNGLQGTYFPGVTSLDALPPPTAPSTLPRTYGAVDHVWSERNPPIVGKDQTALPGLSVADNFGARFEGQFVPPISGRYVFSLDTDGAARVFVTVAGQRLQVATANQEVNAPEELCSHDICITGARVDQACPQANFCAAAVCAVDAECCTNTWDNRCRGEVASACGKGTCVGSEPTAVTLSAGWKYDISVEYHHRGTAGPVVRGATLKLLWSLDKSGRRDVVPAARMLASTDLAAEQIGTGINAAYFSDAEFKQEYLTRVEPSLSFQPASPPSAARTASMICGSPGTPSCAVVSAPAAPALIGADTFSVGGLMKMTLRGSGLSPNASFAVYEHQFGGTPDERWVRLGPPLTPTAGPGGMFNTATTPITVERRTYVLQAIQAVDGQASAWSNEFTVHVTDPAAPPPPTAGGSLAPSGQVALSGTTYAPLVRVNVSVKVEGSEGEFTSTSFTSLSDQTWKGTLTLPPGSYEITITQTSSTNNTSEPAKTVKVTVPVPPVTVTTPVNDFTLACPTLTCPVTIMGIGASTAYGPIIVADGSPFYSDLPTTASVVNGDGSFTTQVELDHGKHQLKVFQRWNKADGQAVPITVWVQPPGATIGIESPSNNQVIDPAVTVVGQGPVRQGLRGKVSVYQTTPLNGVCTAGSPGKLTKLKEGELDDKGGFALPVQVNGFGLQCLAVTHTQSSLSGAGTAESTLSQPVTVKVRPPVPVITKPAQTGTLQPSLTVAVTGTVAVAGMPVRIYAERTTGETVVVNATPAPKSEIFSASVVLTLPGTYRLTAAAVVDQTESHRSAPPVVIAVGDVIPPTLKVSNPADPARRPVHEIPVTATSETGVDFSFGPWVTAIDPSATGGAGTPLAASQIVCQPAAGPAPTRFPLGATTITCTVKDAANNTGSITFQVVVRMNDTPVFTSSNLVAEAQSATGANVNYSITATGLAADCSPPGSGTPQACSAWRPATSGLAISPTALAVDSATGAFYAGIASDTSARLFRSTNAGATWQELASPGVPSISELFVKGGSPAALIIKKSSGAGLRISRDGGQSWLTSLASVEVTGAAQDPRDGAHMLAWGSEGSPVAIPVLYETRDTGVTWQLAMEDLPANASIEDVAMDSQYSDRMYLSLATAYGHNVPPNTKFVRLFTRENRGAWQDRDIYPFASVLSTRALAIFVSPKTVPCAMGDPLRPFPAVIAGPVYSCDGGESWQEIQIPSLPVDGFRAMAFTSSGVIYAAASGFLSELYSSGDHGKSWTRVVSSNPVTIRRKSLVIGTDGSSLYAADLARGIIRSQDQGKTWNPLTTGLPSAARVSDLATDPADPTIAYVALGHQGVFKTTNGATSWEASNGHLQFVDTSFRADKVLLHPQARNVIFAGGNIAEIVSNGPVVGVSWGISTDSAATWTSLEDSTGKWFPNLGVATDPVVPGGWLAHVNEALTDPPTLRWQTGAGDHSFQGLGTIFRLQMVPDTNRTVVASLVSSFGAGGKTALFSFNQLLAGSSPAWWIDTHLLDRPANVVYDASDGTHRLFVSGKAVVNGDPHVLYTAKVSDLLLELPNAWQPLPSDGVFPAFQRQYHDAPFGSSQHSSRLDSFTTLLIDPVGGGQTMYTIGSNNTLWESRDGGKTWRQDQTAPGNVTAAWLSPVDGALYTTISPTFVNTSDRFHAGQGSDAMGEAPGVVWKRNGGSGFPAGSRVNRGNLRVTCQGPPGFPGSVLPGSRFPIGNTALSCSATDAFGTVRTASFTVTVRDTTPPALTAPADTTLTNTTCTSAQNIGTATVSDAVTPTSQIVITITGRPTNNIFKAGVTTVTYTARDQAGNISAARTQRVTVNLGNNQTCCPTGTTIRLGTSSNNTITGGTGSDCIIGLGGNDILRGGGGNDFISGGDGTDQLFGDDGNDRLEGGSGTDTCNGGAGTNTLVSCP